MGFLGKTIIETHGIAELKVVSAMAAKPFFGDGNIFFSDFAWGLHLRLPRTGGLLARDKL